MGLLQIGAFVQLQQWSWIGQCRDRFCFKLLWKMILVCCRLLLRRIQNHPLHVPPNLYCLIQSEAVFKNPLPFAFIHSPVACRVCSMDAFLLVFAARHFFEHYQLDLVGCRSI